ncbi:hypothetical protein [Aeromicrobium panaciterrae]
MNREQVVAVGAGVGLLSLVAVAVFGVLALDAWLIWQVVQR